MSNENLLAERDRLRKHLDELEPFLRGEVYKGWQSARNESLRQTELDIVTFDPVDRKTEIESFKLRGKRELLLDLATQFEDTRETLKSRLDEIEELLQPTTEQHEQ